MTREQIESHISEAVASGKDWIYLLMNGDPGSSRQRLLGHHWGPKGWVCGHKSPNNIVRFNAQYVQEYMDELPTNKVSFADDVACDVATPEVLNNYCDYRGLMYGEDRTA